MAGKRREKVTERQITGLKYFDKLAPLLERLHDDGCARDRAGNRELHYDQHCLLILLYLFNPVVTSLRGLQQASELAKVQKKLGCPRASLGSLSEAASVFDPERLKEIVAELGAELQPLGSRSTTPRRARRLDGRRWHSAFGAAEADAGLVSETLHRQRPGQMAAAHAFRGGSLRAHADRCDAQWRRASTTNGAVLERTVEADRTYVMDRGYAKFSLFNEIVAAGSSYVCRLRDNSVYEVLEERPLTDADRALNVLSDQIVSIGQHRQGRCSARSSDPPDHRSHQPAHQPRQISRRFDGPRQRRHPADRDQSARRARRSHRLDLSSTAGRSKSSFRFFKHVLGCRHLLSHSQQGHRDSNLLRDHRLHVDQLVDRPQTDAADLRDDLLLLHGLGQRRRIAGPSGQTQGPRRGCEKI